jgi:hypothetical protein
MALPENRPLSEDAITVTMADLSTASSVFVASPWRGTIKRYYSAIANAITTADGSVSMEINGTAVTGSTITVTQSGSAAGDVDSAIPTGANYVNEGDTIEIITTGACDTTCITTFTIVIERD